MALESFENRINITDLSVEQAQETKFVAFERLFTPADWEQVKKDFNDRLTNLKEYTNALKILETVRLYAPERLLAFLSIAGEAKLQDIGTNFARFLGTNGTVASSEDPVVAMRALKVALPETFNKCIASIDYDKAAAYEVALIDNPNLEDTDDLIDDVYTLKLLFPEQVAQRKDLADTWLLARDFTLYYRDSDDISIFIERMAKIKVIWPAEFAQENPLDYRFWHEAEEYVKSLQPSTPVVPINKLEVLSQIKILSAQEVKINSSGLELIMNQASDNKPELPEQRNF
jgi:hypothetical protein